MGARLVGSLNTTACVFSFYATKPVATGEGGMLVTRSSELARRVRTMRLHGISRDVFDRYRGGGWYYEVTAPGLKYNFTDIAAAIGLHQLSRAYAMRERRGDDRPRLLLPDSPICPLPSPPMRRQSNTCLASLCRSPAGRCTG